jgi:hypothetical protein
MDPNAYNIQIANPSTSNALHPLALMALQQRGQIGQGNLDYKEQLLALKEQQINNQLAKTALSQAKEAAAGGVLSNYGMTENIVGKRGSNFTGVNSGLSSDPNAYVTNELIKRNLVPQAKAVNELFKTQSETGKENSLTGKANAETTGILSDNEKKAAEARGAKIDEYSKLIMRAGSFPEVGALIDSHAQTLAETGVTPEQAKRNFDNAYQRNGGDADPDAFARTLMQSAQGAAVTAEHFAKIAQTNAQTFQANAAGTKAMGELDIAKAKAPVDIAEIQARAGQANAAAASSAGNLKLAQDKQSWEQNNPGYEIKDTAQGMVAVNKKDPTDVTPIQLNGQTVMPFKTGQTINVGDQTPQFNKSLGEAQAKKVVESQTAAKGAANQLDTIAEGEKLLNSGMYTGTGATFQTSVGQALQKMGFTAKDDAASNAQAYGAIMGKQVGEMVKQFGSGTSISDGDRIYAERMAAGDINIDEQAMRKILRINKEAALKLIRSHNKTVAGVKSDLPLTVPVPASAAPPAEAIAVLKSKKNDPEVKKQFDQWYGEGAAEDVLGQ